MYYPRRAGEALFVTDISEELVKRGHDVTVFTAGKNSEEVINGVKVKRFKGMEIARAYTVSWKMFKALLKSDTDVFHLHHYGYFPATAGFLAAKLRGVGCVIGTYYHPPIYNFWRTLLFYFYHFTQGCRILRKSDKILPHTRYEEKLLINIGAKFSNQYILPNNTDTQKYIPKGKKEPMILFVGPLIKEKGVNIAFKTIEEILSEKDDVKAIFVGSGELEDELKQKTKNYDERITFMKNISDDKLINLYQKASVFVLPSKYEAFGKVLTEAMSCQTPVVATRVGGIPDVVKDDETGYLVDYGNWDGMKEKIVKILNDSKLRDKLGRKGRKHVVENFDTKVIVDKLEKVYEKAIKRRKQV
jgi:glycosyltransferase involved in cell wall biosynthesis